MDRIEPGKGDEFVFLGDYVDSGPQSAEVIEYLINFHRYRKATFLMGNHDAWFLDYLRTGYLDYDWLLNGGQDTLQSYGPGTLAEDIPGSHRKFLEALWPPFKHVHSDVEYVFSHGMLCPTKEVESRFDTGDALWGRPKNFGLLPGSDPVYSWEENQFLVFGHTPHKHPTFYGDQALCIDTGCKVTKRKLTAAILPATLGGEVEFVTNED